MPSIWEEAQEIPDLLRRFVETPYRTCLQQGSSAVTLESNDERILGAAAYLGECSCCPSGASVKVIVDSQLLLSSNVPFITMETGDVIWGRQANLVYMADRDSRQVTVFMSDFLVQDLTTLLRELLAVEGTSQRSVL